jgi:hypothetical protein
MTGSRINSNAYWDGRFAGDWGDSGGREQSRFFAELAVQAIPPWLATAIRAGNWSICDWGCAEGDGTQVLSEAFGANSITGVDFSGVAVAAARLRFRCDFLAEDWLAGSSSAQARRQWDLVFSSNTLEHFANPTAVLTRLCQRARHCVALLIPFRERDPHPEHEVVFTPDNIPYVPGSGFTLAYTSVIDASLAQPSYWNGLQVLLVYVRLDTATCLELRAEQVVVDLGERHAHNPRSARKPAAGTADRLYHRLRNLKRELAGAQARIAKLATEAQGSGARCQELAAEVRAADARSQVLAGEVRDSDAHNQTLATALREADGRIQELAGALRESDAHSQELAGALRESDAHSQALAAELRRSDAHNQKLAAMLREADARIRALAAQILTLDSRAQELAADVVELDRLRAIERERAEQLALELAGLRRNPLRLWRRPSSSH